MGIISSARRKGRKNLTEVESKSLLKKYRIPCVPGRMAKSVVEAGKIAGEIGYPVVMKAVSPDILHKTDAHCVFLNVKEGHIEETYKKIISNARKYDRKAKIDGILIQEMARPGIQIIVGMKRDPQFGPAIAFGLGGIFVEILKDVQFRIAPLKKRDTEEMIEDIKGIGILRGARGEKPRDIKALQNILLAVSRLVIGNPEIKELDLNPVFSYHKGATVVDARIILQ